jgi:hypothetical protein
LKGTLVGLLLIAVAPFVPLQSVSAQDTGMVSGRVDDGTTLRPVQDVAVSVAGSQPTLTDNGGYFVVADVAAGPRALPLNHFGYGEHTESVVVTAGAEFSVEIRLSAQASNSHLLWWRLRRRMLRSAVGRPAAA